jgi:hypothetical protein
MEILLKISQIALLQVSCILTSLGCIESITSRATICQFGIRSNRGVAIESSWIALGTASDWNVTFKLVRISSRRFLLSQSHVHVYSIACLMVLISSFMYDVLGQCVCPTQDWLQQCDRGALRHCGIRSCQTCSVVHHHHHPNRHHHACMMLTTTTTTTMMMMMMMHACIRVRLAQ